MALALALIGCGGGGAGARRAAGGQVEVSGAVVVPDLSLAAGGSASRPLPSDPVVSFDIGLRRGGRLQVGLGSSGGSRLTLTERSAHVEVFGRRAAIGTRTFPVRVGGGSITFRMLSGHGLVSALIISDASDRGALLLHRVAELHARLRVGQYPEGADRRDRLYIDSTGWTSGFWPGALWQAASLEPVGGMFERWALQATIHHFGLERSDSHDVGFMYGQSSLAAWEALCQGPHPPVAMCNRLKRSVLSAARELIALAASNPGAGTIPTDSTLPYADTIVDSMMNIAILPWAGGVTGNPAYARLAKHQAQVIASLLVRPDGSTAQSVHFDRTTGQVLLIHTHQGLSNSSTWARGQGWAVYGFSFAAAALGDRSLLRVAVRLAGYVQRHLPRGGVPRWDYDARSGPFDVSAGMITSAGLFRLAAACRVLPGVCGDPSGWVKLARRMLTASLGYALERTPGLGLLSSQVLNERAGSGCWCNQGELIFGLSYGLEAERLGEGGGR